jgi:hypothetical protein
MVKRKKVQPINWFNTKPSRTAIFSLSPPPLMSKSPSFSALWIPKRQESHKWMPMVRTPRRPVSFFWGDHDGDGVYNGLDCQPFNPFKQGKIHDELDEREREIQRQANQTANDYRERNIERIKSKKYIKPANPARFKTDEELIALANSRKRSQFPGTYALRLAGKIKPDPELPIGKLAEPFHPTRYEGGKKVIKRIENPRGGEMIKITTTQPSKQYLKDKRIEQMKAYENAALFEQFKEYGMPSSESPGMALSQKQKLSFYNKDKKQKIKDIMYEDIIYNRGLAKFHEQQKEAEKKFFEELPKIRAERKEREKQRKKEFYANLKLGDNPNYIPEEPMLGKKRYLKYTPEKTIDQLNREEILKLGAEGEDIEVRLRKKKEPKEVEESDTEDEKEERRKRIEESKGAKAIRGSKKVVEEDEDDERAPTMDELAAMDADSEDLEDA